ncbi:MAG: excinuclease ABC subunit UvrA [bacterium]|nr:excinuclease ABC subunit UvrA [bacterium]
MDSKDFIFIKGAREHNLKNIDVQIPRNKLVVITGLSGSGKSSLAFDTIYAEGQRRYVESLSAYARQFLGQMEKPDVDYIEGLSPAIAIEQRTASKNPRSTVGTATEIYDYLRLMFARIGQPHCYKCGKPLTKQTVDEIVNQLMNLPEKTRIQILAPIVRGRKGEYQEILSTIRKEGFVRARVDKKVYALEEEIKLDKNKKHNIEVVVDRLVLKAERGRLADSIETAFKLSTGIVFIEVDEKEDLIFSAELACLYCGISYEEISPRMFSFNSPYGACPTCKGLGVKLEIDPELVVPNKNLSVYNGAIRPWGIPWEGLQRILERLARRYNFRLDVPFKDLKKEHQQLLLYGTQGEYYRTRYKTQYFGEYEGVIPALERRFKETDSEMSRDEISEFMTKQYCPTCDGARLKKESLAVIIQDMSIGQVSKLSIKKAYEFFQNLKLTEKETLIAHQILKELKRRLEFLINVGVDYLTLDRAAGTLAGGEAQRIQLATQIGSGLMGVLYILDEPSIGLHQRDNKRLLDTLCCLRDLGNTLIVVEHDEATIRMADYVLDLGPGAGEKGGFIVAQGTPSEIIDNNDSLTGKYLKGDLRIPIPKNRLKPKSKFIEVRGAAEHNLKNINVKIPIGLLTCITGVSGSGKSTLISEILYPALRQHLLRSHAKPGKHKGIVGLNHLDKVINIDQSPIGRTPRSNPTTYTGTFTHIRDFFSLFPEAKMRGYKPGRFSFNVKGGRCEACQGDGIIKIEMHFLPDVYIPCEVCKGKRYNRETLEIKYKGKNIADVLDMTVDEASGFFANIPLIKRKLETISDVGLGYIKLGQSATTLSGGEAQRIKLSAELSKRATGKTLYLLDEPTTGLHFADIHKLLDVLMRLRDAGNTIVIIEHNLDVIKTADYIIDLGPEGGDAGGEIVAVGSPEEVSRNKNSYTGQILASDLSDKSDISDKEREKP